jgi:hypothetical protein
VRTHQPVELATARPRRPAAALSPVLRRRLVAVVPPLLVAALTIPFILKQNAWLEWQSPYWLLERQTAWISAHGTPTLFVHTRNGGFSPFLLFYAGPLLTVLAYPAVLIGAWPMFIISIVAATVAGYLGILWAARSLGLSRELAVLPALAYALAPYMLALLYGRGAWSELVAASAVAVAVGALTALLCGPEEQRRRALAALALAVATIAGTHNLTMLMSAFVLPLVVLALLPVARRPGLLARLGSALLAAVLGAGLTGAWLVLNLWLGPQTRLAQPGENVGFLQSAAPLHRASGVLSPWPHAPDAVARWVFPQPSVLAGLCGLLALGLLAWTQRHRPTRALASAAALGALALGLLLLIVDPAWWLHFPRLIQSVQLPMRLLPYLGMVVALGIALTLVALPSGRGRRVVVGALAVAVAAQVVLSGRIPFDSQAAAPIPDALLRHGDVEVDGEPPAFSGPNVYTQSQFMLAGHPTAQPTVPALVPVAVEDVATSETVTASEHGTVGQQRTISVAWSPLIRIDGDARLVGRDDEGAAIVRVTRTDGDGRWTATVHGRVPWPLVAGRVVSLLSALALLGIGARWWVTRRR